MNAYVFLFAITCGAAHQFDDINVGTVLFPSGINKKRWSAADIGLLRARRHFQTLIPPPDMINTNEDFINSLLSYFKDSYSYVVSEAKDPETDRIMNTALSDTIGGYLKAWVLPIMKFAYYGGTVSQENANKLFLLYDEIKQSLGTNGRGWRSPNTNLLNSVSINVASLKPRNTGGEGDPCDSLAFFEKTDTGLSIPVPNINWDDYSASMFVPLKNQSLIPLQSSNDKSLIQYYNAATNCIEASKLEDQKEFEIRFQNWLKSEILPHLNDEKFYPALGNVLSLVNRTRSLVDSVIDLYAVTPPTINKTTFIGIPVNVSSKKMLVIFIIIILEVAWCIPALCFLLCRRIRKIKSNSVYVDADTDIENNGKIGVNQSECSTQCTLNKLCKSMTTQYTPTKSSFKATDPRSKEFVTKYKKDVPIQSSIQQDGLNVVIKNRSIEARSSTVSSKTFFGTGTKTNSSQTCSNVPTIVYERPIHPRHSSANKKPGNDVNTQKSSSSREVFSCVPDKNSANITNSLTLTPELEPTKTVTILKERNRVKKIAEVEKDDKETQKIEVTNNAATDTIKTTSNKTTKCSTKHIKAITEPLTKADSKTERHMSHNTIKHTKSRGGVKLSSGKPYLEITIDRPQRHVSVDFGENQAHLSFPKQSKIPKRTFNSAVQTRNVASKNIQSPSFSKGKSLIPQPKRQRTFDDIIIKNKKTSTKNDILNMTL